MLRGKLKVDVKDHTAKLVASLRSIAQMRVLVGIPEDHTARKDRDKINNAELMYIHTNGSPMRHIPARPVIEPAIESPTNKAAITGELSEAATSVLNSEPEAALQHLNDAGQLGEDAARNWFENPNNGWPPNTPATIAAKGSDRPLVDTGQLRKAITHVVRNGND